MAKHKFEMTNLLLMSAWQMSHTPGHIPCLGEQHSTHTHTTHCFRKIISSHYVITPFCDFSFYKQILFGQHSVSWSVSLLCFLDLFLQSVFFRFFDLFFRFFRSVFRCFCICCFVYYTHLPTMSIGILKKVALRIKNICKERNITYNHLANLSGVTPSTVYSILDSRRREVSLRTLKIICDRLDIELCAFLIQQNSMTWA